MDNISHSLVGLTFAESVYQCYEKKTNDVNLPFRRALWGLSFLANNFPDLDYAYIFLLNLKRLGALLHHRGHTHSLVFGVPQMLLLVGLFFLVSQQRKWHWTKLQWGILALVSFLGVWIHIGMDSLNSYGVHPFWPFDNRWSFTDSLFIVEPFFWVTFAPLLFFSAKHVLFRTVFSTLFLAIIVLCWVSGLVLVEMAAVVTLWGAVLAVLALRSKQVRYVHAATWIFCFVFLAAFQGTSQYAKQVIRKHIKQESPGAIVHDIVLSPAPANPFCWGTLIVESLGPLTSYEITRAITTPFPHLIDLHRCVTLDMGKRYTQLTLPSSSGSQIHWYGSEEFSVRRFRELAKTHCGFSAWIRYARAPAFTEKDGVLTVWDMRYDLRPPNFTEMKFPIDMPLHEDCSLGARWEPPRQDLME